MPSTGTGTTPSGLRRVAGESVISSRSLSSPPGGVGLDFARVYDRVAGLLEGRGFPHAVVGALGLHALEHLVAMKVHAMRNDPARLVQDLADVQQLLRLPETDRSEVRGYFEKAGMMEWYERIIATL